MTQQNPQQSPPPSAAEQPPGKSAPWWKYGHVWMVIGGPLVVVVASFFTLYLAMSRPDPVMDENYYQKGANINQTLHSGDGAMAPALQARNHAATGGTPLKPAESP